MIFASRVLFAGLVSSAGIGSLVPASTLLAGGGSKVWEVSSNPSFSLFTCSDYSSEISISLKLKEDVGQLSDGNQIEFWSNEKTSQATNLSSSVSSASKTYKLMVFPSGKSRLEVKETSGSALGEIIWCTSGVFQATGQMQVVTGSTSQAWEKELKQINLTLGDCGDKNGRRECSIKIGDNIGLSWKDDFRLKVIK